MLLSVFSIIILYSCNVHGYSFNATTCRSKLSSPRSKVAVAYDGLSDIVYILGGVSYTPDGTRSVHNEVHRFNMTSDEIKVIGRLPEGAYGGTAHFRAEVGDILYLPNGGAFLWSFNVTTGTTTSISQWFGSSTGIGLTFLPDKVLAFGGLDDATAIYSHDLNTNIQEPVGNLPLKSELVVTMNHMFNQSTLIFAGEIGSSSPILMEYSYRKNTTTILPWIFPSFEHGEGSAVFVYSTIFPTIMIIVGARINNGLNGDFVIQVSLDTGSIDVFNLADVPTGLTATSAIYSRAMAWRVYFFGGYDQYNRYQDSIWHL